MQTYMLRLIFSIACALAAWSSASFAQTAQEVQEERRGSLQRVIDKEPLSLSMSIRRHCAQGLQAESIKRDRALGAYSLPDAADLCAVALFRNARDGQLLTFYQEYLAQITGNSENYERLPQAITTAILRGVSDVSVGVGKATAITPGLALDAGFTIGYQAKEKANGTPAVAALKPVAERCLNGQERVLKLCYSIGYMYGVRANNRLPLYPH